MVSRTGRVLALWSLQCVWGMGMENPAAGAVLGGRGVPGLGAVPQPLTWGLCPSPWPGGCTRAPDLGAVPEHLTWAGRADEASRGSDA